MFRSGQRTDRRQRGLTLLEMGLSLFTAGVILSAVMVATGSSGSRTASAEAAYFDAIVDALLVFARRNHRLPCPDVNGDGEEDIECPPLVRAGGVPYTTLGIELAVPVGEGVDVKYVYGVYRGGGDVTRDLTRRAERSQPQPHPAGTARFEDGDDFRQALINAFRAPLTQADALVVSRQATVPLQCNSQAVNNVAFVEASRSLADRVLQLDEVTPRQQIRRMFRMVTSRRPATDELDLLDEDFQAYRSEFRDKPEAAERLIQTGESTWSKQVGAIDLAAMTLVANTVLNLDEAIMEN